MKELIKLTYKQSQILEFSTKEGEVEQGGYILNEELTEENLTTLWNLENLLKERVEDSSVEVKEFTISDNTLTYISVPYKLDVIVISSLTSEEVAIIESVKQIVLV